MTTGNMGVENKNIGGDGGLMDMEGVARYLKVSVRTIYDWVYLEKIPVIKLGRLNRFKKETIDHWVDKHTVQPMIAARKKLTSSN